MNSDRLFELLDTIAECSDKKSKLFYMVPEMRNVLFYAYNKSFSYGIKKVYTTGIGSKYLSESAWTLLKLLADRRLTGNRAEHLVASYVRSLTYRSGELFKMIIARDLRCGIGPATINEKFPNLIPVNIVMLAEEFEPDRVEFPVILNIKYDGNRGVFHKNNFFSRNSKVLIGLKDIIEELYVAGITDKLDGELMVPDVDFYTASGLIKNHKTIPKVQYYVFDMPDLKLPYIERIPVMKNLLMYCRNIHSIASFTATNHAQITNFYNSCLRQGYEGCMVKTPDHLYAPGRSFDWMKVVDTKKIEGVVIDVYEGNGKYEGTLGGFIVRCGRTNVRVGSGFSDPQRVEYYRNKGHYIGRTAEIFYREKTVDNKSLRFPRFSKMRPDLDA